MSAEVAIKSESLIDKMEFSKALAVSKLLPPDYRGNPANILFALEYAAALNIEPIHALTSIHIISGKPSASADLIAGLVRRAGHKLRVSSTDTEATATLIRKDDPDFTYTATWTMAKAQAAQLLSNPSWKKYPAAMLRSRAITEVARQGASDALYGVVYAPDELGAEVDQHGAPVVHGGHVVAPKRSGVARLADSIEDVTDAEIVTDEDAANDFLVQT